MATPMVGVTFRSEKSPPPPRDDRRIQSGKQQQQQQQQQHRGGGGIIQPLPHHDGTFERFISSALVAIITIFFSWRVLTWSASRQNDPSTDARGRAPGGKAATGPTVVGKGEKKSDGDPKSGSEVGHDDGANLDRGGGGGGAERDGLASSGGRGRPSEGGGPERSRAALVCAGAPTAAAQQRRYSEEVSSGDAGELAADDNRYPAHGEKRFKADTDHRSDRIDTFDANYGNRTENNIIVYDKYENLPAFVLQPASSSKFESLYCGTSPADRHACFGRDDKTRPSSVNNTSPALIAIDAGQILKSDVSEDYLAGQDHLIYTSSASVPLAVADSTQRSFLHYPSVTAATHQPSIFETGGADQRASSTMSFTSALPSATRFPPKMDQYQLVPMPSEEEMTTWDTVEEQTEENVDEDGRLSRTGFHEMGPWDPIDYDDGSALQGYFDHEYFDSSEDSENSEYLCERRLETILEEDEERESEDDDTDMEMSDSEEEEEEAEDEEDEDEGNGEEEGDDEDEDEDEEEMEVDEEAADGPGKLLGHKLEAANSVKVTSLDDLYSDDESLPDGNAKGRQHESNTHPVAHQSQYSHYADTHAADLFMKLPKTGEIKKSAAARSRVESHKVLNEVKDIFSALVQSNCNSHSGDARWNYFDKGDDEDSQVDTAAKTMSSSAREYPYIVDFRSSGQGRDLEETNQFKNLGTGEPASDRIDRERNIDAYDERDDTFLKTTKPGISELSSKSSVITDDFGNHLLSHHENDSFPCIVESAIRGKVDSDDASSPGNKEHSSIWISEVSVTPTTETVTCRTLCDDDTDGSNKERNSREENANEPAFIHNESVFSVKSNNRWPPNSVNSHPESFSYDRKLDDNKIGQNDRSDSEELKFPRSVDSMHATTSSNNFSSFRTPKPNAEPAKSQTSKNRANSPCITRKHFSVIDIKIDDNPFVSPSPKTDIKELKQRLANVRLKAPPKPFPDEMWNADELIAKFRSREKDINRIGRDDSKKYSDSDTTDYAMKRAKSLSTLPKSARISVSPGFSGSRSFSEATSEANSPQANGCDEKYLKTQSLSDLSNSQKFSVYKSNDLNSDDKVLSQSELRLFESLQQLSIPAWFQNSPRKHQEIVILKNARSIENILADVPKPSLNKRRPTEKATSSTPKPVVISHHVSLPVYKRQDNMQQVKPSAKQFELPSARYRVRSDTPFQPIKILTFEEIMRHKKGPQKSADEQSQNIATKGSDDEHWPSAETEFIEESIPNNTGDKTSLATDPNGGLGRDSVDHLSAENMNAGDYEQHSKCSEDVPIAKSIEAHRKYSEDVPIAKSIEAHSKCSEDVPIAKSIEAYSKCSEDVPIAKSIEAYSKCSEDVPIVKNSEAHRKCSEDVPIAKSIEAHRKYSEDVPIAKSIEAHSKCSEDVLIAKSSETSRKVVPDETIQYTEPIRRRSITRDNSHEEKYPYSVTEMHLARRDSLKKNSPQLSHGLPVSVSRPDIKKHVSDSTEVPVISTSSNGRVLDIITGKEEESVDVVRSGKKVKKLKSGIPGEKRRKHKSVMSDDRQDLNGEDVEIFREEKSKEVIVQDEEALVPEEDDGKQAKRKIRKKKSVRKAEDTEGEAVISVAESAVDESLLSNTIEIEQERTGKLKTRRKKEGDITLLPDVNGTLSQQRQKTQQPDVPIEVQLSLDDARLSDAHLKSVELHYPVDGTVSYDNSKKPSKAKKSKQTKKSTNESELGEFLVSHDDSKQYFVPDTDETNIRKSSKKSKSKSLHNLDENGIVGSLNVTSNTEADQSISQELVTSFTENDGLIRPKKLKKKKLKKTEYPDFVELEQNEPTSFSNENTRAASKKKSRLNKVDDQILVADVVADASDKNLSEYSICLDQIQNKIVDTSQDSHCVRKVKKKVKPTERSFTMETDLDAVESMQSDSGIAGSQLQLEVQSRPPSDERRMPKTRRHLHAEEEDMYAGQEISPASSLSQKNSKVKQRYKEEEILESSSSSLKLKKKAKLKSKGIISSTENVNGIDNSYSSSNAMLGSREGSSDVNWLGSSSNSFVETAAKTQLKARKKWQMADEVANFSPSTSFSTLPESSLAESGGTNPSAWHEKSHTLGHKSNKTRTSANSPRLSKHCSNPGLNDHLVRFEYQF